MRLLQLSTTHKTVVLPMLGYWLGHIILVAGAVPLANILPASFAASCLTAMSFSFVLAARFSPLERLFGGRDKTYIIHRWLGYYSILSMALHWLLASAGDLVLVPALGDFAEDIAVPASITLVVLGALSAIKAMPYHLWLWTHRLLGPVYIILVFHSFFSPIPLTIDSIAWYTLIASATLGILGWFCSLRRLFKQDLSYKVSSIDYSAGNLDLRLQPVGSGHRWQPGQFAHLTPKITGFEEPHPFSFACAAKDDGEARFIIRALGDFSSALPQTIKVGDRVTLSKPAGRFILQTKPATKPQVWLAAGVGITPFLAALDDFNENSPETTLFYCFQDDASAIELASIQAYADTYHNLTLVTYCSSQGQAFDTHSFEHHLDASYQKAELFMCGPENLKTLAIKCWQRENRKGKVQHEHFDFRAAKEVQSLQRLLKSLT